MTPNFDGKHLREPTFFESFWTNLGRFFDINPRTPWLQRLVAGAILYVPLCIFFELFTPKRKDDQ